MKLEQLFQHRSNKKAFRRNNLFSMLQQLFYFRADSYYFLSELWYPCQPARFSQKKKKSQHGSFREAAALAIGGVDGHAAASLQIWRRPLTGARLRRQVTAPTTRRQSVLMNRSSKHSSRKWLCQQVQCREERPPLLHDRHPSIAHTLPRGPRSPSLSGCCCCTLACRRPWGVRTVAGEETMRTSMPREINVARPMGRPFLFSETSRMLPSSEKTDRDLIRTSLPAISMI